MKKGNWTVFYIHCDCKLLSCLQFLPPRPPWHEWWNLELWSKRTLSFWNRFPQNILSQKWSNGKKNQEQSKSFKRRSILCVSFNTCNNLCMQNLLVATSSGPDGLRCCIFRAVTVDLISILEHLMQRFTVFKSLWNCENIKRCDREKKAAKEKKKKKMSISFTLVPSWDHSCLIHTIWGCLIRNYLE